MTSALESLLSRGDYMFRVEHYTAEISSSQDDAGYRPRTDIHLECERISDDWPKKLFPCRFRIVSAKTSEWDRTKDGLIVLGMIRRDSERNIEVGLLASTELIPSFLEVLSQNLQKVFLKLETEIKVQDWNGEGWIPVLSFSLVLGSRTRS